MKSVTVVRLALLVPAAVVALAGWHLLSGQEPVRVRLLAGGGFKGTFQGVDQRGLLHVTTGGQTRLLPVGKLLSLTFGIAREPAPRAGERLDLVSGDVLFGQIDDGHPDSVDVSIPGAGACRLDLDRVRQVVWLTGGVGDRSLPPFAGREDELLLRRGDHLDRIRGELVKLTRSRVFFDTHEEQGRAFAFQRDGVVAVRLAALESWHKPRGIEAQVRLENGTLLRGQLLPGGQGSFKLRLSVGPELHLDLGAVQRVDFENPAFVYLSSLKPSRVQETPFLPGGRKHGLLLGGGPGSTVLLRVGERVFFHGIEAHARTRVTWHLGGLYRRFQAQVGADPKSQTRPLRGSVRVRILLDGKLAWSSPLLKAGEEPVLCDVAGLLGKESLTVEVDFGDSFQVGAQGVVGDPVIKK